MQSKNKKLEQNSLSFFDKDLLIIFLVSKIIVVSLFLLFFYTNSEYHSANIWNRGYIGKEILEAIYIPFSNWDGQHYLFISEYGYNIKMESNAFYPVLKENGIGII